MTPFTKVWYCGDIAFPLPASFIWEVFVRVLPDILKARKQTKHEYELMTLLPQLLDKDGFVLLRPLSTGDTDKRKLFQLSARRRPVRSVSGFIGLTGLRSGKREKPWKVWGGAKLAGACGSIGGITCRRAGAAALASRQSLPALYSNAGKRDHLPAGVAVPRFYLRYFRVTASVSQGIAGAGETY